MKSIAIVIDSLSGGGAEKVMLTLATEFQAQGHHVKFLSLANQIDYDIPDDLDVDCLFENKASKVDRFWSIKASVRKLEEWFASQQTFDLILSNLDKSNNLLAYSNLKNVFYIIHNSIAEELKRQKKLGLFSYLYLKRSKQRLNQKQLICVSKGIEQELVHSDLINPKSVKTIYNPFHFTDIQLLSEHEDSDIPSEPYMIHVGRVAKQKRHDILFKALALMDKPIKLVLLCSNANKAMKMARQHGVADYVYIPGFKTNPYPWIKRAKALVLSSDYEGFPTVLIEALALKTNVVSTRCNHGPSEILTGELAKYLVPARDANRLAEAMLDVQSFEQLNDAEILNQIRATDIAKQYLSLIR